MSNTSTTDLLSVQRTLTPYQAAPRRLSPTASPSSALQRNTATTAVKAKKVQAPRNRRPRSPKLLQRAVAGNPLLRSSVLRRPVVRARRAFSLRRKRPRSVLPPSASLLQLKLMGRTKKRVPARRSRLKKAVMMRLPELLRVKGRGVLLLECFTHSILTYTRRETGEGYISARWVRDMSFKSWDKRPQSWRQQVTLIHP